TRSTRMFGTVRAGTRTLRVARCGAPGSLPVGPGLRAAMGPLPGAALPARVGTARSTVVAPRLGTTCPGPVARIRASGTGPMSGIRAARRAIAPVRPVPLLLPPAGVAPALVPAAVLAAGRRRELWKRFHGPLRNPPPDEMFQRAQRRVVLGR